MSEDLTGLLRAVQSGDRAALDRAFQIVYAELKGLAHAQRLRASSDTLSTTGLVHETYLKFSGASHVSANDREHFFNLAARAMRQVLLDRARIAGAQKRPSDHARLTLDERLPVGDSAIDAVSADLLDLDRALIHLCTLDVRLAEVAEMHLFAGLEFGEIADIRAVSERTVLRDWRKARAILAAALADAA